MFVQYLFAQNDIYIFVDICIFVQINFKRKKGVFFIYQKSSVLQEVVVVRPHLLLQ